MKPQLVVEINEQWLKIVAVKSMSAGGRSLKVIVKPLASLNHAQVTSLLGDVLKQEKIKAHSATLCVSRNQITFRSLKLPSNDPKEIRQMVELNVARIVPEKKDRIIYNFKIFGKDERGYSRVILGIAQKDFIKEQIAVIEANGLFVEDILLSSSGIFSMIGKRFESEIDKGDINLILDIDSSFADLVIFQDNNLLFSRSINFESSQLDDDFVLKKLIGEIRQSLVIFHTEETTQKPKNMFLSGASLNNDNLIKVMQEELHMEIKPSPLHLENGQIPKNVSMTAPVEFISWENTEKGIEFIVPEIQIRKTLREKTKEIIVMGTIVCYVYIAFAGMFYSRLYQEQGYLKHLQKRTAQTISNLGETIKQYQQENFIKEHLVARKLPLFFLKYLQTTVPAQIAVKYVSLDQEKKVVIKGEAQELSAIYKFIAVLEKNTYFKDVKTKSTWKKKIRDKEITEFEINFALNI